MRVIDVALLESKINEFIADDYLIRNGVLKFATHLIPLLIARQALPFIFTGFEKTTNFALLATDALLTITFTLVINAGFKTFKDVLASRKRFADKPLDSYFQVVTIILYTICGVILSALSL